MQSVKLVYPTSARTADNFGMTVCEPETAKFCREKFRTAKNLQDAGTASGQLKTVESRCDEFAKKHVNRSTIYKRKNSRQEIVEGSVLDT